MDEMTAWDIYFANLVAIRFHPKNDNEQIHSAERIEACAKIVNLMIIERRKQWPRG